MSTGAFENRAQCEVLASKYKKLRICQVLHTKLASQQPIVKGKLPLLAKLFDSVSTGGG